MLRSTLVVHHTSSTCANEKGLNIFSLNANSLISKLNPNILQNIITNFDILCFQESKLDVCDVYHNAVVSAFEPIDTSALLNTARGSYTV